MANGDELEIQFSIDPDSISLSPIGSYEVADIEGPAVFVGGAWYSSSSLREMDVSEVRDALDHLSSNDDFQSIIENCPTNTPLVYDDIDYLTRHLPSKSLDKCQGLSNSTPFDEELLLLVAYVERQNTLIGHSDNVLEYYLEQRDEIADRLTSNDEITGGIERAFFSYLLLASALIEELTTETVLNELFREEARIHSTSEHVRSMGHASRLETLCDIQILRDEDHGSLLAVKDRRNNLVHDAQKRAGLSELESRRDAARVLKKSDHCVNVLLTISGKNIESVIARHGCKKYLDHAQSEAVADTATLWEHERSTDLERLKSCEQAEIDVLRWDVQESSDERFDITDGFDFEGFDDEDVYDLLMEFLSDASGAFMDRIDAEANESNLDRFDFALLVLLSADHSYEDIARWLRTDEKYVQRKENVIGWRASTFEKNLVDKIPRPDEPVWE